LQEEKQPAAGNLYKFKLFLLPESWQCRPNFTIINCSNSNLCRALKITAIPIQSLLHI